MLSLQFLQVFFACIHFCASAPTSSIPLSLTSRDDEDFDEEDLSFIQKIGAVGDSYSAGIGAGHRLGSPYAIDPAEFGAWKCSRYNHSYPYLVNGYLRDGDVRDFQFHSCSGALIPQIIDEQLDYVNSDQDVMLVSGGGNDAEFIHILNFCIFQIFSPTEMAADDVEAIIEEFYPDPLLLLWFEKNKHKLTRTCDDQIKASTDIILSSKFASNVGLLIDEVKKKLKKDGVIYYTGYAKFFDSDMADDDFCSKPENTWSLGEGPKNLAGWAFQDVIVQTKENRKKLNDLIDVMNNKIEEVVKQKAEGDKERVIFVNYDQAFGIVQGQFCKKGVEKHDLARIADLAFYPLNLADAYGTVPFKRDGSSKNYIENGTEEFELENLAELGTFAGLNYKGWVPILKSKNKAETEGSEIGDRLNPTKGVSILPDGLGRTFHPTMLGHSIIAKRTIWEMIQRNKRQHGIEASKLEVVFESACPLQTRFSKPRDLECLGKEWLAPKHNTTDGSTPVVEAIKDFCKRRNGQTVERGQERIYDRWDISDLGVPKRHSFWLSAMTGHFSQCNKGTVIEKDCIRVLTGGMEACPAGQPVTWGMKAQGDGCIEYSIDMSAGVLEGNPPWNEHVITYPPPETLLSDMRPASEKHQVDCSIAEGEGYYDADAETAIEQYCSNDLPYGGHDPSMLVRVPGLNISANVDFNKTNLHFDKEYWPTPYADEANCHGFDPKHKNSDDCRYAFRKMLLGPAGSFYLVQAGFTGRAHECDHMQVKDGPSPS
ncbi:SGNH hydrolase [Amniculicola lignicola CBS 123094]|uniref:SGNH hydrolase n=1 Tax=Amniculicola lignicola CBS 123094 TaxID=1392246 RepID=A0A6A5W9R2_9PLEO|nr:SGNH hydrolase [Amniculicola lignicola CBS 123094]